MTDVNGSLTLAFLAGLISFLSPCVLPLVPGYISMLSGTGLEQIREGELSRSGLLVSAFSFVAGLSVVFISLGASASAVSRLLKENRSALTPVAGALVLLFGLHLLGILIRLKPRLGISLGVLLAALGVFSLVRRAPLFASLGALHFISLALICFFGPAMARWLNRDVHVRGTVAQPGMLSAFLLGFAFAFGWSPCIGPILTGVLLIAGRSANIGRGVLLLALYSAGLAVPFLLTALEMTRFLKFYQRFKKHLHTVELLSGGLLLFIGGLVFVNRLTWLTGKLSFLNAVTGWLERPLTNEKHGLLFWSLAGVLLAAIATLILVRYREVFTSMHRKTTAVVLVTVIALIVGTYFADKATRVKLDGSASGTVRADANFGTPAPEVTFKDLDGKDVPLSQYKGKVVLVNFWATWCEPCQVEIPWLIEMQQKYSSQGFTILGVDVDDEGNNVVSAYTAKERFNVNGEKLPMNYPILRGNDAVADKFGGLLGYPTSFLISRDGKIVKKVQGLVDYDEIKNAVEGQL